MGDVIGVISVQWGTNLVVIERSYSNSFVPLLEVSSIEYIAEEYKEPESIDYDDDRHFLTRTGKW